MGATNPPIPQNPQGATYHDVGGSLVMPPQPNVTTYPLRPDQFQMICDGEMSVSRSTRDLCVGAFLTGAVGIAGIFLTINWDEAAKQGRHPVAWTIALSTLTGVALVVGIIEWVRVRQTRAQSAYSRLIKMLAAYFSLSQ